MGIFALSVFINRSQQDVFDFLSDPANLPSGVQLLNRQNGPPAMRPVLVQRIAYQPNYSERKRMGCSRSFNGIGRIVTAIK